MTPQQATELLPCAHCGGAASEFVAPCGYGVECDDAECATRTDYRDTQQAAIAAWNRRAPAPAEPDSIPMPTSANQAHGMVNLGLSWLRQYAPERLITEPAVDRDAVDKAMNSARFVYRGFRYAIEALDYFRASLDNPLPSFDPIATPAVPARVTPEMLAALNDVREQIAETDEALAGIKKRVAAPQLPQASQATSTEGKDGDNQSQEQAQ